MIRSWILIAAAILPSAALAQVSTLHGQVTDESGALVPGAKVTISGAGRFVRAAVSAGDGSYRFDALPLGTYSVTAAAPQLAMRQPAQITLRGGAETLDLRLFVTTEKQQVTVEETGAPAVGTEMAANASAVILRGADLDALPDSPDDLAEALQALAGPAAGPSGGSILIDGFSGGQLPPKESIREIRINQNPFSPEYDKLGLGRIEIFTKPGTDKFRGSFGYNFANDFWNSRNAYAAEKAPFHLNELSGNLSGPLNRRTSFNLNVQREFVDNGSILNGVTLDPATFAAAPFTGVFLTPQRRWVVNPRVDYQLSTNHSLTLRYSFNRDDIQDAGIGGFNLASRGYHSLNQSQTLQATETAIISASVVNETRFQFFRPAALMDANSTGAAILVLGAFNGGGAQVGRTADLQRNYELQNYTSMVRRAHTLRVGVRFREARERSDSPQNYGGTFTFSGGLAPQLDANLQPVLDPGGQPVLVNVDSIESYRRTQILLARHVAAAQIRALGGGATQFTVNGGNPLIAANQADLGVFFGDDWKARPNLTISLGLRYELQTNIDDHRDLAPRIGLAWAPGAKLNARPKNVIRAGIGVFYDRFALADTLTALRYNGVVQQQYIVANPDFYPNAPPVSSLAGPVISTIQEVSSTLRSPYVVQSALGLERELPFHSTAALTYVNSHGLHTLRSEDINAPLGTAYPLGRPGPVFLMESAGLYNQNQVILNLTAKVAGVSLNGSYSYNRANSNTDGLGTFPAVPRSMAGEYGPASTDVRHRVSLSGTITAKFGIRLNPLLTANSGPPFDITAGRDLYGDTLFNARPGIAVNPSKAGLVRTSYGLLDPNPDPSEQLLPRNFGRGPGQIMLNLRAGRTFAFGPSREGGGAATTPVGRSAAPTGPFGSSGAGGTSSGGNGRRFGLTVSMYIRNLTNHNNPGPIIGNITSPLFGQANQPAGSGGSGFSEAANNRRFELQTRFTF